MKNIFFSLLFVVLPLTATQQQPNKIQDNMEYLEEFSTHWMDNKSEHSSAPLMGFVDEISFSAIHQPQTKIYPSFEQTNSEYVEEYSLDEISLTE